ncbi:SMP-30/gluconolactonase/LRE family protein [Caenispirillum bisanense]|uniref:Sugar lactone lactonase YvrE n=1 Tax=Caenispirillum bisanense TaxID=414052 RepID=A0A286H0D4_9PROT|nr:SMP-30/gluconolactonase/LRE family protein [Caenispirillum bisanense]SOE01172.1 Sugar lactone lactonase YvrE [Caenispirillum bisanense]
MAAIAFPSGRRLAALCLVLSVGGCSGAWPEETRNGCRTFTLKAGADLVRGPEDLVWDPVSRHLFVSADPRGRDGRPGVYSVAIDTLRTATGTDLPLTPAADVRQPHGIGLDVARRELAVVDHRGADGQGGATIHRFTVGADGSLTEAGAYGRVRNANDVVPDGSGGVYVTQDHAAETGLGTAWELVTGAKRAAIHRLPAPDAGGEATVARDGLYFANGITRDGDRLYVSEMRAERILVFDGALSGTLSPAGEIPLPGQPDNLNLDEEGGRLLAAVLPEPFVLFLALKHLHGDGRVASAAVGIAPPSGQPATVFGDPAGETVSAATAVEAADGLLVLGSVVAPTLAVCPLPPVSR